MPPRRNNNPTADGPVWDASNRTQLLFAGFLGGTLSVLVKPLTAFISTQKFPNLTDPEFWGGTLILGGLGASIVWLWKETDVKKALAMTVGLPAFLTNITGAFQNAGTAAETAPAAVTPPAEIRPLESLENDPAVGLLSLFVSTAYAQAPTPAPTAGSITNLSVELNSNEKFPYKVESLDASGAVISSFEVPANKADFYGHPLPPITAALRFHFGGIQSQDYPLQLNPGESTVEVSFNMTYDTRIGFAQVFGKNPTRIPILKIGIHARAKPAVGQRGWVYLGKWNGSSWNTSYAKPELPSLPQPGQEKIASFPLNIRDAAASTNERLGIVSYGQKFKLLQIKNINNGIWAEMEVVSVDITQV